MLLQRVVLVAIVIAFLCGSACVFAQDAPVTASETAKRVAAQITGLDTLADVQITATEVTIAAADDNTPIALFKERIVDRPLWKVSYAVDVLAYRNKVNPHIRGFDVYVDVATETVLKVISRNAPNMPEKYRIGIAKSSRGVVSILSEDSRFIENRLPDVTPTLTLADLIDTKGMKCRQYECYYFLNRNLATNVVAPAWLIVFYGTEPIGTSGPTKTNKSSRHYTLAERYRRTFEMWVYDATSGKVGYGVQAVGSNDDTFD